MCLRFKITLYFNIYYNIVKHGVEGIFQQSCPQYRKRDAEDVVPYEHDLKCAVAGVGAPDTPRFTVIFRIEQTITNFQPCCPEYKNGRFVNRPYR